MDCIKLTFNEDRTYGWNVPVTLRSKKPLSCTITLNNGTKLHYDNIVEYQHIFTQHHMPDVHNACVELPNGNYMTHDINDIQAVHLSDSH